MKIYTLPLGPVKANCYLLVKEKHCLVIDPGDRFDIDSFLESQSLSLDAILLTHAHFDHIGGVDAILKKHNVPLYIHESELTFLNDSSLNASMSFYQEIVCRHTAIPLPPKELHIGPFEIEILHTPGHSCGSCCFMIEGNLFSGDTLFQGSIGRMDLPTGSVIQMKESLKKLSQLEDSIAVYPGHGPNTSIAQEKRWNYELRNL